MKQLTFSILASCLLLVTLPAAAKSETHDHRRHRHTHHGMQHHHHAHHSIRHQLHLCLFHWAAGAQREGRTSAPSPRNQEGRQEYRT